MPRNIKSLVRLGHGVRGKSSEEVREQSSPLGIQGYQAFGFCPKGAGKLLKGSVQEQGSGLYVQNSMRGSE